MKSAVASPQSLTGLNILVLEDEFYLAVEIKEGIERAGGVVMGPFPNAVAATAEIKRQTPDCAVVDINLGRGPSFEIVETLQDKAIPFIFLTGYDAPSIPPELADVELIEKPAELSRVIESLVRLTGKARS